MSIVKNFFNIIFGDETNEDIIELSELSTVEELEKYYDAECLSPSGFPIFYCKNHMRGIQVATNYYVCNTNEYPDAEFRGYLVCGGQGSGKTTGSFIPNYLNPELKNASFIILDPSGENFEKTSQFQKEMGREVYLLSLNECADRFNILDFIDNKGDVILNYCKKVLTNSMKSIEGNNGSVSSNSASWFNMAAPLLATAIILLKNFYHKNPHLGKATLSEAIRILSASSNDEFFKWVCDCPAAYEMYPFQKPEQRQGPLFNNCISNLTTNLAFLKSSNIEYLMNDSTIDIKSLRKKPMAIYIKGHPTDASVNAPIITPIIEFLLQEVIKQSSVANSNLDSNNICDVYVFLDEIATLGKIDNFTSYLSNLRKYKCTLFLGVQNINKLYGLFEETETKDVLANLMYKIIFNCNGDKNTALMLSDCSEEYEETEYDCNYDSEGEIIGYKLKTVTKKEISFEDACNIEKGEAYLNIGPIGSIKIEAVMGHFKEERFVKVEDIMVSINNKYKNLNDEINIFNTDMKVSPFLNYYTKNSTLINYPKKENQSMQEVAFGCDDKKSIKEEDIIIKNIEKFIEENFIDDIF